MNQGGFEEEDLMKMDPMTRTASPIDLRSYIADLYAKKGLGDDKRAELEQGVQDAKPGSGVTFLASLGAGLSGKSQSDAVNQLGQGSRDKAQELKDFDLKRTGAFDEIKKDREIGKFERDSKSEAEESDPESNSSKLMQTMAARMMPGQDFSKYSAKQLGSIMSNMRSVLDSETDKERRKEDLAYRQQDIGVRREDVKAQRELKQEEKAIEKEEKRKEKENALTTPYGIARSLVDAKTLKDAHESKGSFDRKLAGMIALREKHKGGAVLNREDVEVGKQLSKDLLLEYKNLAKLGVLSSSDTDIIDAIIPSDPLAFDGIPGQDPTMAKLLNFQKDKNLDFETKISTRIAKENRIAPETSRPELTPELQEALDWADANPDDPMSAAIRKKIGV